MSSPGARDRRGSYQEPDDYENLNEVALGEPAHAAGPSSLEQTQTANRERRRSRHSGSARDSVDGTAGSSTGTISRRQSYANQQRTGRRRSQIKSSDNQDTASTSPPRTEGRRASYAEPDDYENLNEVALAEPAPASEPSPLERTQTANRERRRSLRQEGARTRTRSVEAEHVQQGLSEIAVPPPVQQLSKPPSSSSTSPQQQQFLDHTDTESLGAPAPSVPRKAERYTAKPSGPAIAAPGWLTQIYTLSYLIFFSILGTLARLGMQWLTFYPGVPLATPVIWANFAGSLLFGFLAEDQGLFIDEWSDPSGYNEKRTDDGQALVRMNTAERTKHKKAIPLYIGLTTGFCGSFTSFSSFARDFFLALSNDLPTPISHPDAGTVSTTSTVTRNGGYSFLAFDAVVIATIALSIGGLIVGAHAAIFFAPITPRIRVTMALRLLDPLTVFLGIGCWLGAVFLAIWPPDRPGGPSSRESWSHETWRGEVIFALVFAPIGCLLRFYASMKLNPSIPAFPLGTFAVNMLGTAVEGMCYDIQHVGIGVQSIAGGGRVGCQVLQGVQDGFCGCLTTVSTWVAEINGLRRRHGWVYAFLSVLGALCLMVVIMGTVKWSIGWVGPSCNTGYTNKIHG